MSTISPEESNYRLSSGVSQDKKLTTSSPLSHTHIPESGYFPQCNRIHESLHCNPPEYVEH